MSVKLLKKASDKYGQRKAGAMIGKSATTVNMILQGTYPNPQKILLKVEEVFADLKDEKFECPVIGGVHEDVCRKYQRWAIEGQIKKDRLYMQARANCIECKGIIND